MDLPGTMQIACVFWGRRSVEATAAYSSFVREEVLAPSDADPSAGFSLHVADIIIPELMSACEDAPVPAPALQVHISILLFLRLWEVHCMPQSMVGQARTCLTCLRVSWQVYA